MNRTYKTIFLVIFLFISLFLLKKGLKNKVDPLWTNAIHVANSNVVMLDQQEKKLQRIFDSIHPNTDKNVIKLISKPFLPKISWAKFSGFLTKVITEKKVVIIGASGTGKTTITDRTALIIAGNKTNITKITCTEGLDQDYNHQWVGRYTANGFKPGKLLQLFNNCERNPNKNYVLIIDDFDKIYRSTFFGSAIWNELENGDYKNEISGYSKEITIPKNLFIISSAHPANSDKFSFTSEDYRRLTKGNPYVLKPNLTELKTYITNNNTNIEKDSLISQLYYFSKINDLIDKKIGQSAIIGQWSGIRKSLKQNKYNSANEFVTSHTVKFENLGRINKTDFNEIKYTINNEGKMRNTNSIVSFFKKLVELGLLSEITVALLFALFSFLSFRRTNYIRRKNIDNLIEDIEFIEKKYLNNSIDYNRAYGNLLFIKDDIQELAKNRKLSFSQANYLTYKLKDSIRIIDFVNSLGENNDEISNFMKVVIADDDITHEEYQEHSIFLRKNKHKISPDTYKTVKQQLIKLYQKSRVKHGRV